MEIHRKSNKKIISLNGIVFLNFVQHNVNKQITGATLAIENLNAGLSL
jgi:hypothetical protein